MKAEAEVWEALSTVPDPEIPACTITDLGIVERVAVSPSGVDVDLLPTFSGCPALDVIRDDVEKALAAIAGHREVRVRFVFSPPWTSDRISPEGRKAMASYGLAPPDLERRHAFFPLAALRPVEGAASCPFCGSQDTSLESAFGPTLCRSTHFCRSCRNPFEAFKPKSA